MHEYQSHYQKKVSGEKAYDCKDCGKRYASSLGLRIHTYTHTGEKPYSCDHDGCTKAFTSSAGLKYHLLVHSGRRPYSCVQCGAKFRTIVHVQNHVVKHSDVRPHQCEVCEMAFYNKKDLSRHKKTHARSSQLDKPKQTMPCEYCGKLFNSMSGLESHLRSHTGDRPYACTTCSKAYTNLAGLLYHQKTHSRERNFQCGTCGTSFSSQNGLKIHERTHTGERPFECNKCGQRFTSQSNLTAHQRSHTRAWLTSHHKVEPRPVSSHAIKMRKYREKLKKDPSLAPPSLQGKQKWRTKKPETLRRYRDKLKALDRLRSLPDHEEFDNKRFIESMLELGGRSATKDNIETAEAEIKTLLPHNLVVVDSAQQENDGRDLGIEGQRRLERKVQHVLREEHTYWKAKQDERPPLERSFHSRGTQHEQKTKRGPVLMVNENMQQEQQEVHYLYDYHQQLEELSTISSQGIHDMKVEPHAAMDSQDHHVESPLETNKHLGSGQDQQQFQRMVVRLEVDMPTDAAQRQEFLKQLQPGNIKVHNCHVEEKAGEERLPEVVVVDGLHQQQHRKQDYQQQQQQQDYQQQIYEEESQQHIIVVGHDHSDIVLDHASVVFLGDEFHQHHQTPQQLHQTQLPQHQASQIHHQNHQTQQQQHQSHQHNGESQSLHPTTQHHHQIVQCEPLNPQEETISIIYIDQQEETVSELVI